MSGLQPERCRDCRHFRQHDGRRLTGDCLKWISVPEVPGESSGYRDVDWYEVCDKWGRGTDDYPRYRPPVAPE
jgi:hypothetical protein